MSWAYVVEEAHLRSRSAFDALKAHERIEVLLTSLGIPAAIPLEFATLRNATRRHKACGGPAIVAKLRNELVHAKKKHRGNAATRRHVLFQARELTLGYIELALLAILHYKGRYTRRITGVFRAAAITTVPWA